jgi:signal recognition particle receptor subunit beta
MELLFVLVSCLSFVWQHANISSSFHTTTMSWLPEPVHEHLEQLLDHSGIQQLLKYLPHDLQAAASTPEGLATAVILSATLGLLLLLALSSGSRKRSSTVVLAGPVNSGKSSLFFQIRDGTQHNGLVASMQENSGVCSLPSGKSCRLVDIPGHHSFRHRLEASLRDAAAVVFVVDAVEISPRRVEAAEMLYEVLNNPSFHKQRLPLLLACNKSDLEEDAHSVDFIRKTLEKQLNELRSSKSVGIGKDAAAHSTVMGPTDKPFSFERLRSKVVLVECSATAGSLADVTVFISSCV